MASKAGRKFAVVIIASIQLTISMAMGFILSILEKDFSWLVVLIPILGGVPALYFGANAVYAKITGGNSAK